MKPGDLREVLGGPGLYLLLERRLLGDPPFNAGRQVSPHAWLLLILEADPELGEDEREGALEVVAEDYLNEWTAELE